jgi:hypothetical protein
MGVLLYNELMKIKALYLIVKEIKIKTSMTLFGYSPKLALLCLPYVILSLIVMYKYPEFFDFNLFIY